MDDRNKLPMLEQLFPHNENIENTTIDVVAVHGIETESPKTWIAYENEKEPRGRSVNWLCDDDMLPKILPQARIWVYKYNSNSYSDHAQEVDILGLGETFLDILRSEKSRHIGDRPIVFIGSCFGGIVVAQAIERASRDDHKYGHIVSSIAGIIFLGSPLRGTKTASAAAWLAWLRGLWGKETSDTLLKGLKEEEQSLDNIIQDFVKAANSRNIQIWCFFETRTSQVSGALLRSKMLSNYSPQVYLVPKESACLDGSNRRPLDANHTMMNKFRGPSDGKFKLVSSALIAIVEKHMAAQEPANQDWQHLQWFSSNYRENKDRNPQRVPGTCEWFLNHKIFLNWRERKTANLLWVSADPGCGKSVLARAVVDEGLLTSDIKKSSVCYFFFKDGDADRVTGAQALCALLHQLFRQKPALLTHAKEHFRTYGERLRGNFRTLWNILLEAASSPQAGEIICILDALDECEESAREILITELSRFYSSSAKTKTLLKFLTTSRPYYSIGRAFGRVIVDMSSISLKGEDESDTISREINLVIDHRIPEISRTFRFPLSTEVQKDLIVHLKSIPHRTYLWLYFIFNEIQDSLDSNSSRLKKLINRLPRSVDDIYEKILMKIESKHIRLARRLFQITLAALRPLSLRELNVALSIEENLQAGEECQSYTDLELEAEEPFKEKIRNICGLFLIVIDSKIHLFHQTAKEFLLSKGLPRSTDSRLWNWKGSIEIVDSHATLTKICLHLFLFTDFKHYAKLKWSHKEEEASALGQELRNFDLLEYGAQFWVSHFRAATPLIDESVLNLARLVCDTGSHQLYVWATVFDRYLHTSEVPLGDDYKTNDISVASRFGLTALVNLLLQQDNGRSDPTLSRGHRSPLAWAAYSGHLDTVKLLLQQAEIKVHLDCELGGPLVPAVANSNHEIVDLLLKQDGINVNQTDGDNSALGYAVENDDTKKVQLLLGSDNIEVNDKDTEGQSPLAIAALCVVANNLDIMKLLLAKEGIEINTKDKSGETPLSHAVENKKKNVMKLLLAQDGIDVNAQNNRGETVLYKAVLGNLTGVVRLLLSKKGIDVNLADNDGETPLSEAALVGRKDIVDLLLSVKDVDVNARNTSGTTPLHCAALTGKVRVIPSLLAAKGIDINAKRCDGVTPLYCAVHSKHSPVVKMLLNTKDIDVNVQTNKGITALKYAIADRSDDIKYGVLYETI